MNVNDILRLQAKPGGRRVDDDETGSVYSEADASKFRKLNNGEREVNHLPAGFFDAETQDILKRLESAPEAPAFDESALRKLINGFERKVSKNQEQRVKYADDATKFMDSEVELNDAIQELHILATQPDLYSVILQMNLLRTLIQLLSHDNTDISLAVVDLLQEVTDVDTLNESADEADRLVDALLEQQAVPSLLVNMERLDENVKEEADGVHNTLSVIENILEFKPDSAESIAKLGLMRWLLKRLKSKGPFDANRLYASEILSILVQSSRENRKLLGEMDGIDILLHQLAAFKRHDPASGEEHEMMENLFNCLCSSLLHPPNRKLFLDGEGLQLMNLMLREKKQARNGAVKVLDFALSNDEGSELCNKFVDILGLRTIFPLFMKSPRSSGRGLSRDEAEEHLCAIMASLARNTRAEARDRFLSKFAENDAEKVERLMELLAKYGERLAAEDQQIGQEKSRLKQVDEDTVDQFEMRRLEKGLFTLQRLGVVLLEVYDDGNAQVRGRVDGIVRMRNMSRNAVTNVMRDYVKEIAEDKSDPNKQRDLKRLTLLIQRFHDAPQL